jgi:ferredoxin
VSVDGFPSLEDPAPDHHTVAIGGSFMKVSVDPRRCRGHALCVGSAPEAFDFIDIEDRAVVREDAVGKVPDEVFRAAALECPERAIIIEGDDASSKED